MINVSFITLGCKVNQFETEAMMELFEKEGFQIVPPSSESQIFIINTCAVTKESDRKSRQLINKAKRINKDALVAAVGCSVQLNKDTIEKETTVDIVIGTKNKSEIARLIREKLDTGVVSFDIDEFNATESFEELTISKEHDKTRANIKIQDGCNRFCSYCIIPYVRGPIRSRKQEDILKEVSNLAQKGYKEIVLNGIHTSSFGVDFKEKNALIELVEKISEIQGIERIRFGSLEPRIITDEFMKKLSLSNKVCDHFHLSLQSGSDTVLERMNRKYTTAIYKEKVEIIRKYMTDSAITTDIIVGFPGETDEEFGETLEFVKDIEFAKVHVFKYSVREGTKAATFENQVLPRVKSERSKKLIELTDRLSDEFMQKMIGKEVSVLVEKKADDFCEGYTTNYLKTKVKEELAAENDIITTTINKVVESCLYN